MASAGCPRTIDPANDRTSPARYSTSSPMTTATATPASVAAWYPPRLSPRAIADLSVPHDHSDPATAPAYASARKDATPMISCRTFVHAPGNDTTARVDSAAVGSVETRAVTIRLTNTSP